jgi:hypothetical protein
MTILNDNMTILTLPMSITLQRILDLQHDDKYILRREWFVARPFFFKDHAPLLTNTIPPARLHSSSSVLFP